MKPHEELLAQRDAVLFGTWVRRHPANDREVCAIAGPRVVWLSPFARDYLADSILRWHPLAWLAAAIVKADGSPEALVTFAITSFNDLVARDAEAVIFLLDDAAKHAKEAGE